MSNGGRSLSKDLRYNFSETVVGVELYDYQTDPNESRNLAEDSDYNRIRSQMVKLFDEVLPHLPAAEIDTGGKEFPRDIEASKNESRHDCVVQFES